MNKVRQVHCAVSVVALAAVTMLPAASFAQEIEEVIVQARLQNSAEALVNERMNDDVVTDFIGAEMIGRVGDSTVAAALRRVSGLSLVNDKFVYVRGLGERYSSSTLNGATIPSPDLTRNVIPLDIFPTSIVESLAVQKSYSPDQSASFGGGNIDIRTRGIPDSLTYGIEVSGGLNTETEGLLSYSGGGDDEWGTDDGTRALSATLLEQINRFRGQLGPQSILTTLRAEGNADATLNEAQLINRQIATDLNRNVSVTGASDEPDWGLKGHVGNNYYLTDEWELGFLVGAGYSTKWRKTQTIAREFAAPDDVVEFEDESTRSIDVDVNLNFGLRFGADHHISTTSLYIRNTDDEVRVIDFFNENRMLSSGLGFRNTEIKFEERDVTVHQVKGEHEVGDATRTLLPWLPLDWVPEGLRIDWQYTEAKAGTSIPNEVSIASETTTDGGANPQVLQSRVVRSASSADYRFTDLDDEVVNYGWGATLPIETSTSTIELAVGGEHAQKARTYRQTQFGLGPLTVGDLSVVEGSLGDVFSDTNILSTTNNFVLGLTGTNNQSYLAATMTDSAFAKFDWTWNETWRLAGGARWESYRQVALDWNIYAYTTASPQISQDPVVLESASVAVDDYYPALGLTYMGEMFGETFQLRFGWSETVVRPDLREITDASYVDARTGFITEGNPGVLPAELTNFDVRGEWFFGNGDNLTVSVFYKDIDNPIEFFETPASDTNRAREIVNAESGQVSGIEVEALKELAFLGGIFEAFFVQGNVTIQDSELVAGTRADAPTNEVRKLAGASDYVVNFLVGFDSMDAMHSATVVYNVFGERLYTAGRLGTPDSFEQPFNSLDVTYQWYPNDAMTLKLKLQNLLDEEVSIEQAGVETFLERPGTGISLSFKWEL